MSGAGKSTALKCFEDLGYICIDNMPPSLIETFTQLYQQTQGKRPGVTVVCDVRSGELFSSFRDVIQLLRDKGYSPEVLFFDADSEVLINRFKETRRQPPLGLGLRVEEAILLEKQRLDPVKELASRVIDTSQLTPGQLRELLIGMYSESDGDAPLSVTLVSFGFKYGMPHDADFVFDTRFLPNPFYVEELSQLTGNDSSVRDYVMRDALAQDYVQSIIDMLGGVMKHYGKIYKYNSVIGIGCTGGRHRSVSIANEVAEKLEAGGMKVVVQHRDVARI